MCHFLTESESFDGLQEFYCSSSQRENQLQESWQSNILCFLKIITYNDLYPRLPPVRKQDLKYKQFFCLVLFLEQELIFYSQCVALISDYICRILFGLYQVLNLWMLLKSCFISLRRFMIQIPSRRNSVQLKSVELYCFTEKQFLKFGPAFSLVLQVFYFYQGSKQFLITALSHPLEYSARACFQVLLGLLKI